MTAEAPTLDEVVLGDRPEAWRAAGFGVADGLVAVGSVRLRPAGPGAGSGIAGWSLRHIREGDLDGLPTTVSTAPPPSPSEHPNGVIRLDHVVVMSPRLDRTVAVLEGAGMPLRRIREGPTPGGAMRQAFFRLGEAIVEVVEEPPEAVARQGNADGPARFWGLAFVVADVESSAALLGEHAGRVRDAVQPGRRIVPLRRSAGLGVPVALMSPQPSR